MIWGLQKVMRGYVKLRNVRKIPIWKTLIAWKLCRSSLPYLLQRVCELQEVMEEYLKRCRINLSDRNKLIQDSIRLEAQLSLVLTQLKACLLGGDCDSRWENAGELSVAQKAKCKPIARREAKKIPRVARRTPGFTRSFPLSKWLVRSLRHWASGAAFHTQMLVHLAGLEDKEEPLAAEAVLEQYKEDLTQIIPAYR